MRAVAEMRDLQFDSLQFALGIFPYTAKRHFGLCVIMTLDNIVHGKYIQLNIAAIQSPIQANLLNPDVCNPDFRRYRTDWKGPVPSYTYNFCTHNPDFA